MRQRRWRAIEAVFRIQVGMAPATMSHELELAVPAPRLWRAIKDSQFFAKAVKPLVLRVEDVKGGGPNSSVGDIRIVYLNTDIVPFPFVKQELTYLDEASMTIKAKTIEGGPLTTQFSSHCATFSLQPNGDNACIASWTAEYEPINEKPDLDTLLLSFVGTFKPAEAYLLSSTDYS